MLLLSELRREGAEYLSVTTRERLPAPDPAVLAALRRVLFLDESPPPPPPPPPPP
jgi:hypothetical protein